MRNAPQVQDIDRVPSTSATAPSDAEIMVVNLEEFLEMSPTIEGTVVTHTISDECPETTELQSVKIYLLILKS